MNTDLEKIEVKVKVIEEKKLKAIISLNFGDFIVKGFRVAESKYANEKGDNLWLTPPSYPDGGGRYHPIFYMPNKELWQQLEKKIWDEYYRQKDEHYKKRFDLSDGDVPIVNL